jgi:hypothetical protein
VQAGARQELLGRVWGLVPLRLSCRLAFLAACGRWADGRWLPAPLQTAASAKASKLSAAGAGTEGGRRRRQPMSKYVVQVRLLRLLSLALLSLALLSLALLSLAPRAADTRTLLCMTLAGLPLD